MNISDVPRRKWRVFLEQFSRAHRGWLGTLHVIEGGAPAGGVRSGILSTVELGARDSAARIAFVFADGRIIDVRDPRAIRLQRSARGSDSALEIDAGNAALVRLGFRATARSDELDGMAPSECRTELVAPH